MNNIQEQAVQKVMRQLSVTANDVNRYIADAVLEHDALQAEAERLRAELDIAKRANQHNLDCYVAEHEEVKRLRAALEWGKEGGE